MSGEDTIKSEQVEIVNAGVPFEEIHKDVYPVREDVPADLWGKPIKEQDIKQPQEYVKHDNSVISNSSIDYKFNEVDILDEIQNYIDSTYAGHYNRNKFQSTEFILDGGHGEGFCIGNILKYAQRYRKKGTEVDARKDLLKVIHYAIIAIHNHDEGS